MIIHPTIILIEMVHVHIVQINIYVKKKNVNHVIKNHLHLIHKFIVGVLKIQIHHVVSLKDLKCHAYLIVIYVDLNLNQSYLMY